jgi:hypothetical protein
MLKGVNSYFSPLTDSINKVRKYLSNYPFITDLITKLVITFGVVLIVGGLYLMIANANQVQQTSSSIKSVVSVISWIPGIPVYIGDLSNTSVSIIGLVSWFFGLDLLLLGLGLWVRHNLARFAALMIFALAACFQFIQFLYFGIMGSPASITELILNGILFYFILKFDSQTVPEKAINVKSPS